MFFGLVLLAACLGLFGPFSAAHAQQPATPGHIGVLLVGKTPEGKQAQAFGGEDGDAGYTEGRDVVIEQHSNAALQHGLHRPGEAACKKA